MTQNFEFVRTSTVGHTGWVEFNRPKVNAFNHQMVDETEAALRQAVADPAVRVLVIGSAIDGYLSAGADLNAFRGMNSEGMRKWATQCHAIASLLRHSPKPILAAINGTAVGGGLEMALHADVRFAAADARLGQPEINIAFIPPIATTQLLTRLIGRPRALRYLYEGRMVGAEEALQWGLVDELVPPDRLRAHVQAYADMLSAKSASGLAAIRRTVTLGGGMTFEDGMTLELDVASSLADTPDFAEGIEAFLGKRKAVWARN